MNKRGDFDISLDTALSIARIFIVIALAAAMLLLLSFGAAKEKDINDVKFIELYNSIINCVTNSNSVDKLKLNSLELTDCVNTKENAAGVFFKDIKAYVNERKFANLKGLCGTKNVRCSDFEFIDSKKNVLNIKVILHE